MMIILKKMHFLGVQQLTTKCLSKPRHSIAGRSWRLNHWNRALSEDILSVRSSKLEIWDLTDHNRKRASVSNFWFSYCLNIDITKGKDSESNHILNKNILSGHRKGTASIVVRKGGEPKIRNDVKFKVRSPCYMLTPFADDIQTLCQVPSPPSHSTTPWLLWGVRSIEGDRKTAEKKITQKSSRNLIQ